MWGDVHVERSFRTQCGGRVEGEEPDDCLLLYGLSTSFSTGKAGHSVNDAGPKGWGRSRSWRTSRARTENAAPGRADGE